MLFVSEYIYIYNYLTIYNDLICCLFPPSDPASVGATGCISDYSISQTSLEEVPLIFVGEGEGNDWRPELLFKFLGTGSRKTL